MYDGTFQKYLIYLFPNIPRYLNVNLIIDFYIKLNFNNNIYIYIYYL